MALTPRTQEQYYSPQDIDALNKEAQEAYEKMQAISGVRSVKTVTNRVKPLSQNQSKVDYYTYASLYAFKAINTLAQLLEHRQPNVRLQAASKILDKVIPDLKSTELEGEARNQLVINLMTFGKNDALTKMQEVIEANTTTNTEPNADTMSQDNALTSKNVYSTTHKPIANDSNDDVVLPSQSNKPMPSSQTPIHDKSS
jgi:hypothetical protein